MFALKRLQNPRGRRSFPPLHIWGKRGAERCSDPTACSGQSCDLDPSSLVLRFLDVWLLLSSPHFSKCNKLRKVERGKQKPFLTPGSFEGVEGFLLWPVELVITGAGVYWVSGECLVSARHHDRCFVAFPTESAQRVSEVGDTVIPILPIQRQTLQVFFGSP